MHTLHAVWARSPLLQVQYPAQYEQLATRQHLNFRAGRTEVVNHEWDPKEDPVIVVLPDGGINLAYTDQQAVPAAESAAASKASAREQTRGLMSLWRRLCVRSAQRTEPQAHTLRARQAVQEARSAHSSQPASRSEATASRPGNRQPFLTVGNMSSRELHMAHWPPLRRTYSDVLSEASTSQRRASEGEAAMPARRQRSRSALGRRHSVLGDRHARRQRWRARSLEHRRSGMRWGQPDPGARSLPRRSRQTSRQSSSQTPGEPVNVFCLMQNVALRQLSMQASLRACVHPCTSPVHRQLLHFVTISQHCGCTL